MRQMLKTLHNLIGDRIFGSASRRSNRDMEGCTMQKTWTHPEYSSIGKGCAVFPAHAGIGWGRHPQSRPTLRRKLNLFSLALVSGSSAVVSTLLIILVAAVQSSGPTVAGLQLPEIRLRSIFGSAKESYLLGLSREEQRREFLGQVHYVTEIIGRASRAPHEAKKLAVSIVEESYRAKYDPLFVAAVIKSESLFKKNARSHVGALGLMQIMPDTARFVAQKRQDWRGSENLNDPDYNLQLGIAYLKHLEEMFNGNLTHVLIAYNWGPGNLIQALEQRGHIPSSTVQYAKTILSTHKRWKQDFDSRRADISTLADDLIVQG